MFYQYRVGDRVMSPGPGGMIFDLTDSGGALLVRFSLPTAAEKHDTAIKRPIANLDTSP